MAVTYSASGVPITPTTSPGLDILTHIAAGFLALTLVTDLAYLRTTVLMWKDFSSWLLFCGMIVAGIAAVVWIIAFVTDRLRPVWPAVLVQVLALAVAFFNNLLHAGDGWTAIMPWGIAMSALTCLLMLCAALLNRRADARV